MSTVSSVSQASSLTSCRATRVSHVRCQQCFSGSICGTKEEVDIVVVVYKCHVSEKVGAACVQTLQDRDGHKQAANQASQVI
jgi:hypothetical protein